ncbi:unnamed protein product [Amoebophrya sp. A25]|nr:unnamed protein product [Amoebophrya sp. A25]|eukprot:GSA25T00009254001.1
MAPPVSAHDDLGAQNSSRNYVGLGALTPAGGNIEGATTPAFGDISGIANTSSLPPATPHFSQEKSHLVVKQELHQHPTPTSAPGNLRGLSPAYPAQLRARLEKGASHQKPTASQQKPSQGGFLGLAAELQFESGGGSGSLNIARGPAACFGAAQQNQLHQQASSSSSSSNKMLNPNTTNRRVFPPPPGLALPQASSSSSSSSSTNANHQNPNPNGKASCARTSSGVTVPRVKSLPLKALRPGTKLSGREEEEQRRRQSIADGKRRSVEGNAGAQQQHQLLEGERRSLTSGGHQGQGEERLPPPSDKNNNNSKVVARQSRLSDENPYAEDDIDVEEEAPLQVPVEDSFQLPPANLMQPTSTAGSGVSQLFGNSGLGGLGNGDPHGVGLLGQNNNDPYNSSTYQTQILVPDNLMDTQLQLSGAGPPGDFDPYATQAYVDDNFSQLYGAASQAAAGEQQGVGVGGVGAVFDPFASNNPSGSGLDADANIEEGGQVPGASSSSSGPAPVGGGLDLDDHAPLTAAQERSLGYILDPPAEVAAELWDPNEFQTQALDYDLLYANSTQAMEIPYDQVVGAGGAGGAGGDHNSSNGAVQSGGKNGTTTTAGLGLVIQEQVEKVDLETLSLEELGPWSRKIKDRFGRVYSLEQGSAPRRQPAFLARYNWKGSEAELAELLGEDQDHEVDGFDSVAVARARAERAATENPSSAAASSSSTTTRGAGLTTFLPHGNRGAMALLSEITEAATPIPPFQDRPIPTQEQMTRSTFFQRHWHTKIKDMVKRADVIEEPAVTFAVSASKGSSSSSSSSGKELDKDILASPDEVEKGDAAKKKQKESKSKAKQAGSTMKSEILSSSVALSDKIRLSHAHLYMPQFLLTQAVSQELTQDEKTAVLNLGATFHTEWCPQITHLVLKDRYAAITDVRPNEDPSFLACCFQANNLPGIVTLVYLRDAIERGSWPPCDNLLYPLPGLARAALHDARADPKFFEQYACVYYFPSAENSSKRSYKMLIEAAGSKFRANRPKIEFAMDSYFNPKSRLAMANDEDNYEQDQDLVALGGGQLPLGGVVVPDDPIASTYHQTKMRNHFDYQRTQIADPFSQQIGSAVGSLHAGPQHLPALEDQEDDLLADGGADGLQGTGRGGNNMRGGRNGKAAPKEAGGSKQKEEPPSKKQKVEKGKASKAKFVPLQVSSGTSTNKDAQHGFTLGDEAKDKELKAQTKTSFAPLGASLNPHQVLWIGKSEDYKFFEEQYKKQFKKPIDPSSYADIVPPICDAQILCEAAFRSNGSLQQLIARYRCPFLAGTARA